MGCMLRHVSKISASRVMIRRPKSSFSWRSSTFVILNTWCAYRLYHKKLCNFLKWSIFSPFSIIYLLPLKLLDPHYWWLCGTNTHAEPKSNERNADLEVIEILRRGEKKRISDQSRKNWERKSVFLLSLSLSLVCSHKYQPKCVFLNESMLNHGVTLTEDSMSPSALPLGVCVCSVWKTSFCPLRDHQVCCQSCADVWMCRLS